MEAILATGLVTIGGMIFSPGGESRANLPSPDHGTGASLVRDHLMEVVDLLDTTMNEFTRQLALVSRGPPVARHMNLSDTPYRCCLGLDFGCLWPSTRLIRSRLEHFHAVSQDLGVAFVALDGTPPPKRPESFDAILKVAEVNNVARHDLVDEVVKQVRSLDKQDVEVATRG